MSRKEGPPTRLSDWLVPSAALGAPQMVLATSFDLDPEFMERDWLPSVLGLSAKDDASQRTRTELEIALARLEQTVLLTEASRFNGRPKSLRVRLSPARSPHGGVLHAKVTFVVYPEAVRLLVGSANLTPGGYRLNREVALPITATAKEPAAGNLIRQALDGAAGLLAPWWSTEAEEVVKAARRVLDAIRAPQTKRTDDEAFLWSGPLGGDAARPLWEQFLDRWPKREAIEKITVVSPFWSASVGEGPIGRLAAELRARKLLAKDAGLHLVTAWAPAGPHSYVPVLHPSYGAFDFASIGLRAFAAAASARVDPEDVPGGEVLRERPLHAKCVLFEGAETALAYAGSANFTSSGWGFGGTSNVEAGVALKRTGRDRAALQALVPKTSGPPALLDGKGAVPLATPPEIGPQAPWPGFLSLAELRRVDGTDQLSLRIEVDTPAAPEAWAFSLGRGRPMRDADTSVASLDVALGDDDIGALLREQVVYVRWSGTPDDGVPYPVNAAASLRERLAFTDAARQSEQDLLAYYVGRIDAAEAALGTDQANAGGSLGTSSPERTVDTSQIVSYQIRAFVEALRGIEEDIQSSLSNKATIRLALNGPISPVTLARQARDAVKQEKRSATAGGFQLVELAALLHRCDGLPVDERLEDTWRQSLAEAKTTVKGLLDEVRALGGDGVGARSPFGAYARVALQGGTT